MNIVDIILLVIAILFAAAGWRSGFVRAAGSLVAFIASLVAAFYGMSWLHDRFGISFVSHPWLTVIAFLVLLMVAKKLASLVVGVLDLVRKTAGILPFVNLFNSILGAMFGLLQVVSLVFAFAYIAVVLVPVSDARTQIVSSTIVSRVIDVETSAGIL